MQRVNIFPIYLPAAGQIYQLQYIEIFDAGCGRARLSQAWGEFNVAESLKSPLLASPCSELYSGCWASVASVCKSEADLEFLPKMS